VLEQAPDSSEAADALAECGTLVELLQSRQAALAATLEGAFPELRATVWQSEASVQAAVQVTRWLELGLGFSPEHVLVVLAQCVEGLPVMAEAALQFYGRAQAAAHVCCLSTVHHADAVGLMYLQVSWVVVGLICVQGVWSGAPSFCRPGGAGPMALMLWLIIFGNMMMMMMRAYV
jgi:hypothetical protein